jgi:mevalonate kinase
MSTGPKSKILIFIIAVLLIANIGMLVFYKKSEDEKKANAEKNRFGLTPFLKDQMKFSEQQMKDFEQLKTKQKETVRPYFDSLKSAKTNLYKLLDKSPVSDSTVYSLSANIGKNQGEIDRRFFIYFQNVRNLCTPEQRIKFDTLFPPYWQKMINMPFGRNNRPPNQNQDPKRN